MGTIDRGDAWCVEQVLAGNREQFGVLVERHGKTVHAVALAHTRNAADAEDVTQETFLKAFRSLGSLRKPQRFLQWIITIARNTALSLMEKRREVAAPEAVIDAYPAEGPDPSRDELHRLLRAQLDRLDTTQREVLTLHYYGGHTTAEISKLLGISQHAAKKRLSRAREALGTRMVDALGDALEPERGDGARKRRVLAAVAAVQPDWAAGAEAVGATGIGVGVKAAVGAAVAVGVVVAAGVLTPVSIDSIARRTNTEETVIASPRDPAPLVEPDESVVSDTAESSVITSALVPPVDAAPKGPGRIDGIAYGPDGSTVSGAVVELFDQDAPVSTVIARAETTSEGRFRLAALPPATYLISVQTVSMCAVERVRLGVVSASLEEYISVVLRPRSFLAGRVRDAFGDPIANAFVRAKLSEGDGLVSGQRFVPYLVEITDEAGAFRLDALWEGSWDLDVTATGYPDGAMRGVVARTDDVEIVLGGHKTIRGTLTDLATGTPAANARVSAGPVDGREIVVSQSDQSGNFRLCGLETGTYALYITHSTLAAEEYPVIIVVGEEKDEYTQNLALTTGGIVEGQFIERETGGPVSGMLAQTKVGDKRQAISGHDGTFRFEGLPRGNYMIAFGAQGGEFRTVEERAQRTVEAVPGTTVRIDPIFVTPKVPISGMVVNQAREPIAFARVECMYPQFYGIYFYTDGTGRFSGYLDAPVNGLQITAHKEGYGPGRTERLQIPSSGLTGIELQLRPNIIITGTLHDAWGEAVWGATLLARATDYSEGPIPATTTGPDGRFAFEGLWADTYHFTLSNSTGPGPDGRWEGYEVVEHPPIAAREGERTDKVTLVVEEMAGGEISGTVCDSNGAPIPGANIRANPSPRYKSDSKKQERFREGSSKTGRDGRFTVGGLDAPGYVLQVYLRGYTPTTIPTVPTGTTKVRIELQRNGNVTGLVLDRDTRTPIYNAAARVTPEQYVPDAPELELYTPVFGTTGEYRLNAPAGIVSVEAKAPGYVPGKSEPFEIRGDVHNAGPAILLERGLQVAGFVHGTDGVALESAAIYVDRVVARFDTGYEPPTYTDAQGRFVLEGIEPDRLRTLIVQYPGLAESRVDVMPTAAGPNEVDVPMLLGGVVEGRILFRGQPVPDQFVSIENELGEALQSVHAALDGTFRFVDVPVGLVSVSVNLQSRNGMDLPSIRLVRTAEVYSVDATEVDMDFGMGEAGLHGTVTRNGTPVADEWVNIAMETPLGAIEASARTGADGTFAQTGLPAGPATVTVRYDRVDREWKTAMSTVDLVAGRAVAVEVVLE